MCRQAGRFSRLALARPLAVAVATHYHELARLADHLPGLRNYQVQVQEGPDDIIFLHRIAPGCADKSYGIHAARLAGVPRKVLERAQQVLGELEGQAPGAETRPVILQARRDGHATQAG